MLPTYDLPCCSHETDVAGEPSELQAFLAPLVIVLVVLFVIAAHI
ncbi:MAG TPA: hypothetical protein VLT45_04140 [Kofleriaceae bacterium]|nr:hypothetical protein [Kofleriaceae bacterium]